MTTNWQEINLKLLAIKQEITNQSKRAIKKNTPKSDIVRQDIRDSLVKLYNEFTRTLATSWSSLDNLDKSAARQTFLKIRDRIVRAFQALEVKYKVPIACTEEINPLILEEDIAEDEDAEDLETMAMSCAEFFNLASKLLPNQFDGSPSNLQSFLDALELLNANATDHTANAVAYIKTRLTGKARDLITSETSIIEIIAKLKSGIKGESSRSITAKLQNLKQNAKDAINYAAEIELLAENLKKAYISEGVPYEVAGNYSTEATVRTITQNANSERARLIIEAGTFKTVQEVVTKFINVGSSGTTSNVLHFRQNTRNCNYRNTRGRWHRNFNNFGREQNNQAIRGRCNQTRNNHSRNAYRNNFRYNNPNNFRSGNDRNSRSVRFYETGDIGVKLPTNFQQRILPRSYPFPGIEWNMITLARAVHRSDVEGMTTFIRLTVTAVSPAVCVRLTHLILFP